MSGDDRSREKRFQLWGWILFVICAAFFIASAVEGGSTLSLIGGIIFLFACLVFIAPLIIKRDADDEG